MQDDRQHEDAYEFAISRLVNTGMALPPIAPQLELRLQLSIALEVFT